jgi:hypothetical protein
MPVMSCTMPAILTILPLSVALGPGHAAHPDHFPALAQVPVLDPRLAARAHTSAMGVAPARLVLGVDADEEALGRGFAQGWIDSEQLERCRRSMRNAASAGREPMAPSEAICSAAPYCRWDRSRSVEHDPAVAQPRIGQRLEPVGRDRAREHHRHVQRASTEIGGNWLTTRIAIETRPASRAMPAQHTEAQRLPRPTGRWLRGRLAASLRPMSTSDDLEVLGGPAPALAVGEAVASAGWQTCASNPHSSRSDRRSSSSPSSGT